jgi:hypothetical protein
VESCQDGFGAGIGFGIGLFGFVVDYKNAEESAKKRYIAYAKAFKKCKTEKNS